MHKRRKARRAGRPAKAGPRTASGKRSRAAAAVADFGSPDAARHRHALINGAAVELAGSVLTVLLANDHLTREQVQAGERYRRARELTFGQARPRVAHDLVEPHDPSLKDPAYLVKVRARFEAMVARLEPDQKAVLDVVTIDQRLPVWFRIVKAGRSLRPVDEAERQALIGALDALAGTATGTCSPAASSP